MAERKPLVWDGTNRAQLAAADTIPLAAVPVMVASGASAAKGLAPVPPVTAGTTKFLREDATWAAPAGGGGAPDVYEDGASVVAGATRIDFKDANAELISGTLAALYLDLRGLCEGRLTTETGVPVSTSDRVTQGTIYWTPYNGSRVALYDGTRWKVYRFTEVSKVISGLTSGNNYDVFLYDNAGTLTLELSAAWTSDTIRADALALQNGVYVKSGATTRRYLGTFRSTGIASTEDSKAKRFVWNVYNMVPRPILRQETTTSWTYNGTTWRQANAATANRVEVVMGLAQSTVSLGLMVTAVSGTNLDAVSAIGEDSTTAPQADCNYSYSSDTSIRMLLAASLTRIPGIGYHAYNWIERQVTAGAGSATFYGVGTTNILLSGLSGFVLG